MASWSQRLTLLSVVRLIRIRRMKPITNPFTTVKSKEFGERHITVTISTWAQALSGASRLHHGILEQ
jgi:hypothetical protein